MAGGIALSRVLKFTSQLEGRHAANHMNHEHTRSCKQGLTPSGDGLRTYSTEQREARLPHSLMRPMPLLMESAAAAAAAAAAGLDCEGRALRQVR